MRNISSPSRRTSARKVGPSCELEQPRFLCSDFCDSAHLECCQCICKACNALGMLPKETWGRSAPRSGRASSSSRSPVIVGAPDCRPLHPQPIQTDRPSRFDTSFGRSCTHNAHSRRNKGSNPFLGSLDSHCYSGYRGSRWTPVTCVGSCC